MIDPNGDPDILYCIIKWKDASMRIKFITRSILIISVMLLIAIGFNALAARRDRTTFNLGSPSHYPPGTVKHLLFHDCYLISDDEGIYVLSSICPFRGGPTFKTDNNNAFVCRRCHSRYDLTGKVIRGPSHDPLNWIKLELDKNGDILLFRKYRGVRGKKIPHQ
jgi:nitrite reductase/ring-hydroxylating ferredoxin subunit